MSNQQHPLDHGQLSGIRRRSTPRQKRQHAAGIERTIDQAMAAVKVERDKERAANIAAYREANKPIPYTPDELKAAHLIRTELGWHKVVKVNAKTVTVETGYSWTDRIALAKVLEVRTLA